MTDTKRTTVTLSNIYMDMIDELVGVFGRTQAAVINNIVQYFFNDSNNFALLEELRSRKKKQPTEGKVDEKLEKLLKGTKSIKLNDFLEYLNIDRDYLFDHLEDWKNRFNLKLDYDKIIKSEDK
ncbi:MAG: hypothetical protein ACQERB_12095 [Promethearchaeati archaeon]